MSTNYYLKTQDGREFHIGKASVGWAFALHVEPDEPEFPSTLSEWRTLWAEYGTEIESERGELISPSEMERIVTARTTHAGRLLRRVDVDGVHCIGRSEGADYIVGDFS